MLLALLAGALILPASAAAQVAHFEGDDGDQPCASALDWGCLPTDWRVTTVNDAIGGSDDVFAKGKEESPTDWTFTTGSTNGKTDIVQVRSAPVVLDGVPYLHLSFDRVGGGDTANAFFSFELNQADTTWVNPQGASVPCRTNGDVLVSYELPNVIKLYVWENGRDGSASCPQGGRGDWTALTIGGEVEAATAPPYTFGEAVLNLADVVSAAGLSSCRYYKSVQAHSRQSQSFATEMSDFVAGSAIGIVACPPPPDPNANKATAPTIDQPSTSACTGDGTITLTGTYAAGTQVEVREGVNSLGLATLDAQAGTWTLNVPASDGPHTFSAVAHETGKNDSDAVSTTITVDNTRPAAPTVTSPAAGTTVAPGTVTVAGTAEPLADIEILENGQVIGQATADANGAWSTTVTVAAGAHSWSVTAADCAAGTAQVVAFTAGTGGPGGTGGDGTGTGGPLTGLPPVQEVAGDIAGCVSKAFTLHVAKKGIRRIVFRIDGKKVKTARAKKVKGKSFTLRINPVNYSFGKKHKVRAQLFLKNGKKRTVPMRSFTRCNLGKCVSRRSFRIHVKKIRGERVRSAVVRVNGKKVKTVRGKRLSAPVNLVGLPAGKVTVKIVSRTASGRKVTDTRHYRTCVPKKKPA